MSFHVTKKKSGQAGFTFIEMIVTMSIFSLVLLGIADIFIRAHHAQQTSAALQKLHADMRFVLDRVTDEIRRGGIDYAYYAAATSSPSITSSTLALITPEGQKLRFSVGASADPAVARNCKERTPTRPSSTPCVLMSKDADADQWERLSAEGLSLTEHALGTPDLRFIITPAVDPFIPAANGEYGASSQPKVTIQIGEQVRVRGLKTHPELTLQTTVATRQYRR